MDLESLTPCILAPASITELMNNPNSKTEDILKERDLLRLSFTSPTEDISCRSFAILEHSDPTLTEAMLSNDQLRDIASSILWSNSPESIYLSRLSSLTLVAFLYSPSLAHDSCGYILQMLNYVSVPSVLSLFYSICSPESGNAVVQQWLLHLNFTNILYKEIECFKPPFNASRYDEKANQLCGLLKIVTFCSNSTVLADSVRTKRFVEVLNRDLGQLPEFIEDCRWEAVASVHCAETLELMRGFFNSAINIIMSDILCPTLSGVSAIKLLTMIVQNDQVLRPYMSIAEVTILITNTMIMHPNHTVLQQAARMYLKAVFLHPKTRENAIKEALPSILEASKTDNRALKASMCVVLNLAVNLGKTDTKTLGELKNIEGFLDYIRGELAEYNMKTTKFYGGAAPPSQETDPKTMAESVLSMRGY